MHCQYFVATENAYCGAFMISSLAGTFRDRLKYLIEKRAVTITALASSTKIHRNTLHRYLAGGVGIDLDNVQKLAGALAVEPIDLLCPGEHPEPLVIEPSALEALKIVERALKRPAPDIPEDVQILLAKVTEWDMLRQALIVITQGDQEIQKAPDKIAK